MSKIETLYKTKWLSLKKMTLESVDVEYIYVHSEASNGQAVAVLPFRTKEEGSSEIEFLVRNEIVPPWTLDRSLCSLTGMHEGGSYLETAKRELKEESGYEIEIDELIELGLVHNSKASDTEIHLFAVDLTGKEEGEVEGDGSILEALGTYDWVPSVFDTSDSILLSLYAHLAEYLRNEA